MFCPPEYVSLEYLSFFFDRLEMRYLASTDWWRHVSAGAFAEKSKKHNEKNIYSQVSCTSHLLQEARARSQARLFHAWVLDGCFALLPTYLCSPQGVVLKVSDKILRHDDEIHLEEWHEIDCPKNLLSMVGELSFNHSKDAIFKGFRFVEYPSGLIVSHKLKSSNTSGLSESVVTQIKNFTGWSICFKEKDFPDGDTALLKLVGFDEENLMQIDEYIESEAAKAFVLDCVLKAYPDGKTDKWDNVEPKVGFSRRHIVRVLEDAGLESWRRPNDWKKLNGQG